MSRRNSTSRNARARRGKKDNSSNILAVLIVILIAVIVILFIGNALFNKGTEPTEDEPNNESSYEQDVSSNNDTKEDEPSDDEPEIEPTPTVAPTPEPTPFIPPWNLLLVNEDSALPQDYTFTQVTYGNEIVDERMYNEMAMMMNDAANAGLSLWIASGYRSVELQERILTNATNNRMSDYGMTQEEARANALETIALPGHSEHHTGLAIDFNYVNYDFEYTTEFTWLQENAEKYGFVLRFPADKVDITKINYEPWHYRYVGAEHAVAMNDLGMCLEEYLDYLGA